MPSDSSEPAPPLSSTTSNDVRDPDYRHYMKMKLVKMMEDDVDLERRATKRGLMAMKSEDIDAYMMAISAAHKYWWQAAQGVDRGNGSNLE